MTAEQAEKFKALNIDIDDALERFAGSDAMYLKFVKKFPGDPSFPDLKKFLGEKNIDEAFRAAHTLKGVASNLAMKELMTVSSEITELLRDKEFDLAVKYFPQVEEVYDKVIAFIATLD